MRKVIFNKSFKNINTEILINIDNINCIKKITKNTETDYLVYIGGEELYIDETTYLEIISIINS